MSANNYQGNTTPAPNYTSSLIVLTSLFFMWGLITSLNDILIPHLQGIFNLNNFQAMLVQFCFFTAYFIMSYPSGYLVERFGYKRGIIIGLATAGIGCLLFYPAAALKTYPLFLFAFFVLASGITLLQVAANPYVTILGSPDTASRRLNLTQAFNSLGTTIGPYLGAMLILTATTQVLDPSAEARNVQGPYLGLAAVLFLLALAIGMVKLPQIDAPEPDQSAISMQKHASVWGYRHLVLGAIGIFVYVGAEVSIGSFLVNLFHQPDIANLTKENAGKYVSFYWGGAMVGRFLGVLIMKYVKPGHLLGFNALVNVILLGIAMSTAGHTAMYLLLAMGLFNSIMFPTIFSLALDGLGHFTSKGSGILCMAIVGGAILPLLQGALADHIGILHAFIIPLMCYLYIAFYGFKGHQPV